MSDLFWIARNINVELGLLWNELSNRGIPSDEIKRLLESLYAITAVMQGKGGEP